jgi:hypothetical protein
MGYAQHKIYGWFSHAITNKPIETNILLFPLNQSAGWVTALKQSNYNDWNNHTSPIPNQTTCRQITLEHSFKLQFGCVARATTNQCIWHCPTAAVWTVLFGWESSIAVKMEYVFLAQGFTCCISPTECHGYGHTWRLLQSSINHFSLPSSLFSHTSNRFPAVCRTQIFDLQISLHWLYSMQNGWAPASFFVPLHSKL